MNGPGARPASSSTRRLVSGGGAVVVDIVCSSALMSRTARASAGVEFTQMRRGVYLLL